MSRVTLFLNYFVFAILLNTVGIVIAQVITDYGVSRVTAGSLEAYKDLSIMLVSFVAASYVPRLGYKRSMMAGLIAATGACVLVAAVTGFWVTPVLYAVIGSSFALMKTAVYSTVGIITDSQRGHTSLMNTLEGIFMIGALSGPLLFSAMIRWQHWNDTYWILAVISGLALAVLWFTDLDESAVKDQAEQVNVLDMFRLLKRPIVWAFVVCAFLYVMIEQAFGTWLPTFNTEVFKLSAAQSAAFLSIFAGSIALARFLAGYLMKRYDWLLLQLLSLLGAFLVVCGVLWTTWQWEAQPVTTWYEASPLVFLFSAIGLFIGSIYPTICSIVLNRVEPVFQSPMTGLIILFSALGGTSGSLFIGFFSQHFSTKQAFLFPLIPIVLLAVALVVYHRMAKQAAASTDASSP